MIKLCFRVLRLFGLLFLVSLATFCMIDLVPGDPVSSILGEGASPAQYEALRARMGLNRPLIERYWEWLGNAVQGDLGASLVPPIRDVNDILRARLPVTLQVTILAMAIALVVAIPAGVWSAYRADGRFDRTVSGGAFALISIPSFLKGLLLVFLFVFHPQLARNVFVVGGLVLVAYVVYTSRKRLRETDAADRPRVALTTLVSTGALLAITLLAWKAWPSFPRQGFVRITDSKGIRESLRSTFLPALTLGLTEAAVLTRVLRTDMIATLNQDFILSARARGLPTRKILLRHALRPSSFSLFTVAGVSLGRLIGGAVIVEAIFRLPGMGTLIIDNIIVKDYAIVQAGVLVIAIFYVLINATVDAGYNFLDPRLRRETT